MKHFPRHLPNISPFTTIGRPPPRSKAKAKDLSGKEAAEEEKKAVPWANAKSEAVKGDQVGGLVWFCLFGW